MAFTGNEASIITRATAKTMIANFQKSDQFKSIKGGFFGKTQLMVLLNQPNCVGVRYYHALNAKNQPTLVLVGEDGAGTCLSDGILIDDGPLCPPWCPEKNGLDS